MSTQGVRRSMEKQGKYAKNKILGTDARTDARTHGRTHGVSDGVTP